MKLKEYDVTFVISDPDHPEIEFRVVLKRVKREKLLTKQIPLKDSLLMFEDAVKEGGKN
jgi:hypothetical protein